MEAIRQEVIDKANSQLTKRITDYLKQFEKLEKATDNQLIGWRGGDAYFIELHVVIHAHADKAIIEKIN